MAQLCLLKNVDTFLFKVLVIGLIHILFDQAAPKSSLLFAILVGLNLDNMVFRRLN